MRFEASCCTKQELWTARILPFSSLSNTPLNVRIHTEIRYRHELSIFHHQDWYFLWQMSYSFLGKWRKVKQTELGEKQWDSPTREQMLSCSLKRDRLLGSSASLCWPYPHMILQFYFFIFFLRRPPPDTRWHFYQKTYLVLGLPAETANNEHLLSTVMVAEVMCTPACSRNWTEVTNSFHMGQ